MHIISWWLIEFGWTPLLPVRVYKPRTLFFIIMHSNTMRSFFATSLTWLFPGLYDTMQRVRYRIKGKRVLHEELLSRIDFAFTPLPIELKELKKRHPYIKAEPYRLGSTAQPWQYEYQKKLGCILFDHSAMSNNNHLDLLSITKKLHLTGRNVYIPLS